jgi:hypothetical protein
MIENDKLNASFSYTFIDEEEEVVSMHLNVGLVTLNDSLVVLSDLKSRLQKQQSNNFMIYFK